MGRDQSLSDSVFLVAELLDVAVPLELQHVLDRPQERRDAFMNIRRLARENGARSPRSENRARKGAVAESVRSKSTRCLLHAVRKSARFDFETSLQTNRPPEGDSPVITAAPLAT